MGAACASSAVTRHRLDQRRAVELRRCVARPASTPATSQTNATTAAPTAVPRRRFTSSTWLVSTGASRSLSRKAEAPRCPRQRIREASSVVVPSPQRRVHAYGYPSSRQSGTTRSGRGQVPAPPILHRIRTVFRAPALAVLAVLAAGPAGVAHAPRGGAFLYVFPDRALDVYAVGSGRVVQHIRLPDAHAIHGVAAAPRTSALFLSVGGNGGANGTGAV